MVYLPRHSSMMPQQSRILNASETCQRGGFHPRTGCRQIEQNTEILTGPSTTPTSDRPWLARRTVANPKTGLERPRWVNELQPERHHQRAERDGRRDLTAVPSKQDPQQPHASLRHQPRRSNKPRTIRVPHHAPHRTRGMQRNPQQVRCEVF